MHLWLSAILAACHIVCPPSSMLFSAIALVRPNVCLPSCLLTHVKFFRHIVCQYYYLPAIARLIVCLSYCQTAILSSAARFLRQIVACRSTILPLHHFVCLSYLFIILSVDLTVCPSYYQFIKFVPYKFFCSDVFECKHLKRKHQ